MKIRQETPADYAEVYELVKISFATSTNEGEWDYLNEVRKKAAFIPKLSLVAENDDGRLVGQIVLYKTDITTPEGAVTQLLLSPISVHPDYFRRGIATAMMKEAFQIAQELGYTAVFLCGIRNFTIALDSGDLMNSGFTMWRTSPAAGNGAWRWS